MRRRGVMAEFPFRSLRDWLEYLDSRGELVHNKQEVNLTEDISAISYKACQRGQQPVIHENIRGYPGWRIASNTMLGRERQAAILNVDLDSFQEDAAPKLDRKVPPMEVSTGPCKELKFFGDDVDLTKIPIPFTGELEGTPNITAGVSNIRDIETGWQNIAVRRFGLKGKRRLSEFINAGVQQDYLIWAKYRRMGKKCPIAIILAPDPLVYLVSQSKQPVGVCEYELWGAFTGSPLEVVKCETCDLWVPANAEVVIEGEIDPVNRELDGPFPELFGYYTTIASVAQVNVKAITMRKDPIYYYINMGMPPTEGHDFGNLMYSLTIYRELSKVFPGILDAKAHRWGLISLVKVDKNIAMSLPNLSVMIGSWLRSMGFLAKGVIVVDQDVGDLNDWDRVFDMVLAKCQASKDITILPRGPGTFLDPSEPWLEDGVGLTSSSWIVLRSPHHGMKDSYVVKVFLLSRR